MQFATYPLTPSPHQAAYRFVSRGPRGAIEKLIQFSLINQRGPLPMYNLAFGDAGTASDELNDLAVSDNGDAEQVLATVVAATQLFLADHPDALVYAEGSTPARTRLYRMGLTRLWAEIQTEVRLFGLLGDELEPFEPGRPYQAFIAQRKIT